MRKDHHFNFVVLRQRHPVFVFESFEVRETKKRILIQFHFHLDGEITFKPEIAFPKFGMVHAPQEGKLDTIAFNVGMIELISYWKAACSPRVLIKAGKLNEEQIQWWKKTYFLGLGEFFYLNNIGTNDRDFMTIICAESAPEHQKLQLQLEERCLVPIGGGKDSAVTLELLQKKSMPVQPMIVNPRHASRSTALNAGYVGEDILSIERNIDKQLLSLNKRDYLNGHTPFSASLAFNGMFAALLQGFRYLALSNESSANEPTIEGTHINHQYSKSLEFESDFRSYAQKFIHPDFEYFSFLRPLNEYGITYLFARLAKYHGIFKSCNVGSKKDEWCNKCPKCLFTYIMLNAQLKDEAMEEIFGTPVLDDADQKNNLKDLLGLSENKPFECVGTVQEVRVALTLALAKYPDEDYPLLLKFFKNSGPLASQEEINEVKDFFDSQHFLPPPFLDFLKDALQK